MLAFSKQSILGVAIGIKKIPVILCLPGLYISDFIYFPVIQWDVSYVFHLLSDPRSPSSVIALVCSSWGWFLPGQKCLNVLLNSWQEKTVLYVHWHKPWLERNIAPCKHSLMLSQESNMQCNVSIYCTLNLAAESERNCRHLLAHNILQFKHFNQYISKIKTLSIFIGNI